MKEVLHKKIEEKTDLLGKLVQEDYSSILEQILNTLTNCISQGHKIILAGNGGSAADAQHFAGEIVGRFLIERQAMPAISLCVDPSVMTCIGNDYGFDAVFERQLEGLGQVGDVFVAISTSGNSANLVRAVQCAKENGIQTVGLLGKNGGKLKQLCDYAFVVPSLETPRIQEIHTFIIHLLCEQIELKCKK